MCIRDSGSNNRSVNVYCGYRFRMPDGNKDKAPTGIDISYWNNMLKLTIAHLVKSNGNNGEYYTRDRDNRADEMCIRDRSCIFKLCNARRYD